MDEICNARITAQSLFRCLGLSLFMVANDLVLREVRGIGNRGRVRSCALILLPAVRRAARQSQRTASHQRSRQRATLQEASSLCP